MLVYHKRSYYSQFTVIHTSNVCNDLTLVILKTTKNNAFLNEFSFKKNDLQVLVEAQVGTGAHSQMSEYILRHKIIIYIEFRVHRFFTFSPLELRVGTGYSYIPQRIYIFLFATPPPPTFFKISYLLCISKKKLDILNPIRL